MGFKSSDPKTIFIVGWAQPAQAHLSEVWVRLNPWNPPTQAHESSRVGLGAKEAESSIVD
jgi:hypothetical protein